MMILNVVLIIVVLKISRCSLVRDTLSQNALYVSSYCPEMKGCMEGSHVICQYYNHHRPIGHMCKNYVKISITPEMVHQITDGVNKIRMNLAIGKETGKDGRSLPRAYGMMKMHWDSELATLAQVFADQCLGLKEDECRATDKFSSPSQLITLINFKAPNWDYLTSNSTERGLTTGKVKISIGKALRSMHGIKSLITPEDINECPAMETLPNKGSRSYLKLVRGKATHIGCGISAYRRSHVMGTRSQHIYNTIQLVCNVSDGPQQSQPVYTTDPPIPDTGFTEKCGCPEGSRETKGCLCEAFTLSMESLRAANPSHEIETCDDPNGICNDKSNVAMLPIFEILDAPTTELVSSYEHNDAEEQFHNRLDNSSFNRASMEENKVLHDEVYQETSNEFSKPLRSSGRIHEKIFKNHDHNNVDASYERTAEHLNHITSIEENSVENTARRVNDYDDRITAIDISKEHTDNENTFLSILDRLERAVKNVELEGPKRDIVDFKMRKIYEAALKSKGQSTKTDENDSDRLEEIKRIEDYLQHKSDIVNGDKNIKLYENESVKIDEIKKIAEYLHHKSDGASGNKHIKTNENELDKMEEIKKIIDYLEHKSNGVTGDKSVHTEKNEEVLNFMDPQNKEDDALEKLFDLLHKKPTNNHFDHNKNEFHRNKHSEMKGHNEIDAYNTYPPSRQQEKINSYIKNLLDFNKGKNSRIKMDERHTKMFGKNRIMRTFNTGQSGKENIRGRFLYPEHKLWKTRPKPPGYRRVLETENERPTLPTTTTVPTTNVPTTVKPTPDKVKLKIYISDTMKGLPK